MVDPMQPQGGGWQPQSPWSTQWNGQQNYNYYPTQQQAIYNPPAEMPKKSLLAQDIPITTVVIGILVVWILIFGGVFGYMFTQPCQFVALTSGDAGTLAQLEEKFSLNLHDNPDDCRTFVRTMIMGTPPAQT